MWVCVMCGSQWRLTAEDYRRLKLDNQPFYCEDCQLVRRSRPKETTLSMADPEPRTAWARLLSDSEV